MAKEKKGGLGGGMDSLFSNNSVVSTGQKILEVSINDIEPNENQPRQTFDQEKIEILAQSIKDHGIIQPIIVKKEGTIYRIIAGERRYRAARVAGLKKVPIVEKDVTDREIMEMALIENIQREDLNPIEEADAYSKLIKEYELTQEKVAEIVGRSRSAVTNTLRLLNYTGEMRSHLISGALSAGHARALLSLESSDQLNAAKIIIDNQYSVRQAEELVKKIILKKNKAEKVEEKEQNDINDQCDTKFMQNQLKNVLGTKVKLEDKSGKGRIVIEYFSSDERERLFEYLLNQKSN